MRQGVARSSPVTAGWSAEYEVASPGETRRVALEAQMAAIAITDIKARTGRYAAAGVEVCWFTDRKTVPWLDAVPSVQIARPEDGGPAQVTGGAAGFGPEWCRDRADCDWNSGCVEGAVPCEATGSGRRSSRSRSTGSLPPSARTPPVRTACAYRAGRRARPGGGSPAGTSSSKRSRAGPRSGGTR